MTPPPELTADRAAALIRRLAGRRVAVVGDAMLDTFISGRVLRISPEAPVPVVTFDHESRRLGGAANVAHNVAALGGHVTLVAVTGADSIAATLTQACRDVGIDPVFIADRRRLTTNKIRIVTDRKQQVARIDYETDDEVDGDVEARVIAAVDKQMSGCSAVVISDYVKGGVTRRVCQAAITAAVARNVPVLVDPKIPHIGYYAGATLIKPNQHETELATNLRMRTDEDVRTAARLFRERAGCASVLVTLGDRGMWLGADGVESLLPASAREVADVTGAGDTVIATLALALAAGGTLPEAAQLANHAAGVSVGKFGPGVVTPSELRHAAGAREAPDTRR